MSNILVFNLDGEQVKHYYQWDSAQHIVLHDVNINDTNNVHFCNADSEQAIVIDPVIDGNKLVARVPDELLQVAKPLIIYLYRTDENTGNKTVRAAQIIVIPRPRPSDYVYTATESLSYAKLDRKIDEMAKEVVESFRDAVLSIEQAMSEERKEQARENIGAASKKDLEELDFMPKGGDPEAEVRFDVAHAQMMTAPEFVIADPAKSAGSIILTKEGAEEGKEPRKAVMLTDPSGKPVVMSNVADPEKETDVANKKFVGEQVDELSKYLEDLVFDETIQVYGAKVGQILKVEAVDEDGHPTAWEAVEVEPAPWRHIRTVTIPEDITTDMSGLNFATAENGGILFGFDSDENGEPFEINEVYVSYQAGSLSTAAIEHCLLTNSAIPKYAPSIAVNVSMRIQADSNGYSNGWVKYENCGGKGYHIGASQQSGFKTTYASTGITFKALSFVPNNDRGKVGFKPNSKFDIFGR